jgi:hypothetical protein
MPVTDARTAPVHDVAGTRFTPLAAPSSGSTEICVWRVELRPHAHRAAPGLTREAPAARSSCRPTPRSA